MLHEFVRIVQDRDMNTVNMAAGPASQSTFGSGASKAWLEQDQLYEVCQKWHVNDWQDMYSPFDVDNLFENFVSEVS